MVGATWASAQLGSSTAKPKTMPSNLDLLMIKSRVEEGVTLTVTEGLATRTAAQPPGSAEEREREIEPGARRTTTAAGDADRSRRRRIDDEHRRAAGHGA